jgi:hypothetical protein
MISPRERRGKGIGSLIGRWWEPLDTLSRPRGGAVQASSMALASCQAGASPGFRADPSSATALRYRRGQASRAIPRLARAR